MRVDYNEPMTRDQFERAFVRDVNASVAKGISLYLTLGGEGRLRVTRAKRKAGVLLVYGLATGKWYPLFAGGDWSVEAR